MTPKYFKGGISIDARGSVSYNNKLILKKIKRFYFVQNKKKVLLEHGMDTKLKQNIFFVLMGEPKYLLLR